jgi:hypothetical protein
MPDDRLVHPKCGYSEKVTMLTDLEFRVWIQYMLSADDFGVMPMSVSKLKSENHHLENRPVKTLQRCLDALVKGGLVRPFSHQGRIFLYQHDWQKWQKVEYPRRTNNPKPIPAALDECDEPTRALFEKWPGGERRKKPRDGPSNSDHVRDAHPEHVPTTRAGAPAERLTANGVRLEANGSEEVQEEGWPPMDIWARELINLYPKEGRCGWNLVERPLFTALTSIATDTGTTKTAAWEWLKARLELHKRSHQWRDKQMVKRVDRWLTDGLYLAEPAEDAPADKRTDLRTPTWAQ